MALLHRVRDSVLRRLSGRRGGFLPAVLALALAGCEAPPELQPGPLLQDSLGLTTRDRVHVIRMTHRDGREVAEPDSVVVRPGDWVDFVGADGHPRWVEFAAGSMDEAPRDFLSGNGMESSPPLLGRGVHWAVPFLVAPAGRYPFRIEGGGEAGAGVVVVAERARLGR